MRSLLHFQIISWSRNETSDGEARRLSLAVLTTERACSDKAIYKSVQKKYTEVDALKIKPYKHGTSDNFDEAKENFWSRSICGQLHIQLRLQWK